MTTTDQTTGGAPMGVALRRDGYLASYERISRFRVSVGAVETNVTRGVVRQREDAIDAAATFGLGPVARFFRDDNRSASRFRTKEREDFEILISEISSGHVRAVLIWLLDRIIRTTEDLDRLLAACRETGTLILQTASGLWIDARIPESVLHAKISGAVAEYEAAKTSLRVARLHRAKAEAGQFHGGRRRFGFNQDMTAHEESEAAIIRELAARLIAGGTLHALAKELETRGVRTSTGKTKWIPGNLSQMFINGAHLAGMRVYKGDIVRQDDGNPVAAQWKAILTAEEWFTVRAILTNPARKTNHTGTARRHTLVGISRCGVCETPLGADGSTNRGFRYVCKNGNHVGRDIRHVDNRVAFLVAAYVEANHVDMTTPRFVDGEDLQGEADAIHERLRIALEDRTLGVYTRGEYEHAKALLTARLAAIDARRVRVAQPAAALEAFQGVTDAETALNLYREMDLDARRAVVQAIGTVFIDRAAHKGARFDPHAVRLVPHNQEGA